MEDALQNVLAGIIGLVVSLIFSYVPVVSNWFYNKVDGKWRGLIIVGVSALITAGVFGASCLGWMSTVACDQAGALDLLRAFLILLATNQLTYLVTPTSPAKLAVA